MTAGLRLAQLREALWCVNQRLDQRLQGQRLHRRQWQEGV